VLKKQAYADNKPVSGFFSLHFFRGLLGETGYRSIHASLGFEVKTSLSDFKRCIAFYD
jgi:hypothetical protein